jgi:hypothetical protein
VQSVELYRGDRFKLPRIAERPPLIKYRSSLDLYSEDESYPMCKKAAVFSSSLAAKTAVSQKIVPHSDHERAALQKSP